MTEQQNGHDDNRQWFLRINGETVFGPVTTQGLIVWAEQGRILPGHEVSHDRKKWVQAVSVEFLDMRWFVDDGDGELRGPLNRLAAEALIKSGKVSPTAQVVAADDVEAEPAVATPVSEKKLRDSMPEDVLQRRVHELESIVSEQRERLSKLADTNAVETVQHERDVLAALLKEAEEQKETLIRNAEKDARANERKLEQLRLQVKQLEQKLEDAASSDPRVNELEQALLFHERQSGEREQVVATREAELTAAQARAAELEARLAEAERAAERAAQAEEALAASEQRIEELATALARATARAETAEAARAEAEARASQSEAEWEEERRRVQVLGQKLERAEQRAETAEKALAAAEARASASEASLAEVLNDANARDISYQEKIAELEKLCAQPPEETARFYADQAAVYELINAEVAELAMALERERAEAEQLKNWSAQRQQSLLERRQKLLKHLGGSPGDMTRRTVREQPSEPQIARLRAELENMRVTYQREMRLAETKERELQEKVRLLEAEGTRLLSQIVAVEKRSQQLEELEAQIRQREHELAVERKNREEEREQFEANQRALLMRIETLEKAAKPSTPEEQQSAEARSVKLASWMRLKG
ncbi:MAG TPA: hypothetical protein P5026_10195 [Kiritimatiellia bacterium]|nr:hypothetical protein [Kiritimatiellia bacterium]HRU70179.1 hypothetical protein [Kiritimatiellia bacterium]